MSDYIPTIEEARNVYAYIGQGFAPGKRKNALISEAEFDRMIANVKVEVLEEAAREIRAQQGHVGYRNAD